MTERKGAIALDTFDFIIVGAGSAGCVLANRLSEDGLSTVLLIEAGGSDRSPLFSIPLLAGVAYWHKPTNWGYQTTPQPGLDGRSILYIGASLLSFLLGAILSGYIIGQKSLKLGRRYGSALYIEATLLLISYFLYKEHDYLGQLTAAMACGLQNAMVATYSGAVIRTTHLTGLTSDMGATIGNWLAGRPISKPTLGFQAIIWYCFCGGGAVGGRIVGCAEGGGNVGPLHGMGGRGNKGPKQRNQ